MKHHIARSVALILLSCSGFAAGAQGIQTAAQGGMEPPAAVEAWRVDPTTVFDASEIDIEAFQWVARPVVIFADAPVVPAFQEQMDLLQRREDQLATRDVVVVTDTNPDAMSELRQQLRPRGFMLVLIGKDGEVALRKPFPWDVREITRSIDKMPMRMQELREEHGDPR